MDAMDFLWRSLRRCFRLFLAFSCIVVLEQHFEGHFGGRNGTDALVVVWCDFEYVEADCSVVG